MISELKPNQVFVFGSNRSHFHGAGAASFAFSGTTKNDWRTCPLKQNAIKKPREINPKTGKQNVIGRWNVWGYGGHMLGYLGQSYAIVTCEFPGGPPVKIEELSDQLFALMNYCDIKKDLEFLLTRVGTGYAGFTDKQFDFALNDAIVDYGGKKPENLTLVPKYV